MASIFRRLFSKKTAAASSSAASSSPSASASASNSVSSSFEFVSLPLYHYSKSRWSALESTAQSASLLTSFSCLSYNVFFSPAYQPTRVHGLLSLLERERPSLVGLQEMTAPILEFLVHSPFIQQNYYISDIDGRSFRAARYGVVLLIEKRADLFPEWIRNYSFPTLMGRSLVMAKVDYSNQASAGHLLFGSVHLESLMNAKVRCEQLKLCRSIYQAESVEAAEDYQWILVGDMNFDSLYNYVPDDGKPLENTVNMAALGSEWHDLWVDLQSSRGLTFDSVKNPVVQGFKKEQARYDRIFAKTAQYPATSISIVGNQPIDRMAREETGEEVDVFISDHFGLKAIFNRATDNKAENEQLEGKQEQ